MVHVVIGIMITRNRMCHRHLPRVKKFLSPETDLRSHNSLTNALEVAFYQLTC
jgi:hypothetical protein